MADALALFTMEEDDEEVMTAYYNNNNNSHGIANHTNPPTYSPTRHFAPAARMAARTRRLPTIHKTFSLPIPRDDDARLIPASVLLANTAYAIETGIQFKRGNNSQGFMFKYAVLCEMHLQYGRKSALAVIATHVLSADKSLSKPAAEEFKTRTM